MLELIPVSESHLRSMLKMWVTVTMRRWARVFLIGLQGWYFPPTSDPALFGARAIVCARSVLGGMHREYSLASVLA
jgi:hypothetical protein